MNPKIGGPKISAPARPVEAPAPKTADVDAKPSAPLEEAPIPTAAMYLSGVDLRFFQEQQKKDFPAKPDEFQRIALMKAACATAEGLAEATKHAKCDPLVLAVELEATTKLLAYLAQTGMTRENADAEGFALGQLIVTAEAMMQRHPVVEAGEQKERALARLSQLTRTLAPDTGPHALATRVGDCVKRFNFAKSDDMRGLITSVGRVSDEVTTKIAQGLAGLEAAGIGRDRNPLPFFDKLFAQREHPQIAEVLKELGVPGPNVAAAAKRLQEGKAPPSVSDPDFKAAFDNMADRYLRLLGRQNELGELKMKNESYIMAYMIERHPDLAERWCQDAAFLYVTGFPLPAISPRDVGLMAPAERAVYEVLADRKGTKHALIQMIPSIGGTIAVGVAASIVGLPAIAAGVLAAAVVGSVRVAAALTHKDGEVDAKAIGIGGDGQIARAKDHVIAAVGEGVVGIAAAGVGGAVTAKIAAGQALGRAVTSAVTARALQLGKPIAAQLAADGALGGAAGVLTTLANPAFWQQHDGKTMVLFEATIAGVASGTLGSAAGLTVGGACRLIFRPPPGQRLAPGATLEIETQEGARVESPIVSIDPAKATITTKHGTFPIEDASLLEAESPPFVSRALVEGAKKLAAAPRFDKNDLSKELRAAFKAADDPTKRLMRLLGNDWLDGVHPVQIVNKRLVVLFEQHGATLVTWMRKNRDEALGLLQLDHVLSGRVLTCFETNDLGTLVAAAKLFKADPHGAQIFFIAHEGAAAAKLLQGDSKAAIAEVTRLRTQFVAVPGKRELMAIGAPPPTVRAATPLERRGVAERAGVFIGAFDKPAEHPREVAKLIKTMTEELTPDQRLALKKELDGRRLIDDEHYQPLFERGVTTPEHRYGARELAGWQAAEERVRRAAEHGDPLTAKLLNEAHEHVFTGDPKYKGRLRAGDAEWVGQGERSVGENTLVNLKVNPQFKKVVEHGRGPDGRIRVTVIYADPKEVALKTRRFLEGLNVVLGTKGHEREVKDPIALAAWAQREFVSIHPFADCNGRLSRLIMDYVLARTKSPPSLLRLPSKDTDVGEELWKAMVGEGIGRTLAVVERHWVLATSAKGGPR